MKTTTHSLLLTTGLLFGTACARGQAVSPKQYWITTLIGGDSAVNNIPARHAWLRGPWRLAVARDGSIYFGESFAFMIRKVTPDGILVPVAGTGSVGNSGDGGPALAAELGSDLTGLAVDGSGNVYFADTNFTVRKIGTDGVVNRYAGTGQSGFGGDGGPATSAQLATVNGIALDLLGNLYIATSDNRVRKVAIDGRIDTVAGTGQASHTGDGGPASQASIDRPSAVTADAEGNLYIAEASFRIRRVSADRLITTVAGNGTYDSAPRVSPPLLKSACSRLSE